MVQISITREMVEAVTGNGDEFIREVGGELSRRLTRLFLPNGDGLRRRIALLLHPSRSGGAGMTEIDAGGRVLNTMAYLHGDRKTLDEHILRGHQEFMLATLLSNQLATVETPTADDGSHEGGREYMRAKLSRKNTGP